MPVRHSLGDGGSWAPEDWPEDSPWIKLFYNAKQRVG